MALLPSGGGPWSSFGPHDGWMNLVHSFARAPLAQTYSALYWLSQLFDSRPRAQCVLELGTLYGALSAFFGMHFPGRVVTCDIIDHRSGPTKHLHERLGVHFELTDVLHPDAPGALLDLCRQRIGYARGANLFLFCDNGGKEKEFLNFVPHLQPGDVVAAHDLHTEFHPERPEIRDMITRYGLVPWREEEMLADSTFIGVWEVPARP